MSGAPVCYRPRLKAGVGMLQFFYRQRLFAAVCAHLYGVDGRFFMLPMRLQRLCAFVAILSLGRALFRP